MPRLSATASHLAAFSHLLANDSVAGKLHMRDLQVIALVVDRGQPMTVGEIAGTLSVTSPYISRLVEKLVTQGLLKRTTRASDRRLVLLDATPAARALDERVRQQFAAAAVA